MRVVRLQVENMMRIVAIDITPDGNVVIGGPNGAGKSSLLNALMFAVCGKKYMCDEPLRKGATSGYARADLGDIIVERTVTATGGNLTVTSKDGAVYQRPQDLLNKLIETVAFDPLEVTRMDKKQRLELMKQLVGLDFTGLDEQRAQIYQERASVNRIVVDLTGQVGGLRRHEGLPESPIDVAGLAAKSAQISCHNADLANAKRERDRRAETHQRRIQEIDAEIVKLQKEREEAVQYSEQSFASDCAKVASCGEHIEAGNLAEQIAEAEATNQKIRENAERERLAVLLKAKEAKSEALTKSIDEIDEGKAAQLASAKFPIEGLSFDETDIRYNDIPFSQISSAEKLRVSASIAMALNPELRIMLIRDASLLDDTSFALLETLAGKNDFQLWLEMVGRNERCSVIIKEGMIAE